MRRSTPLSLLVAALLCGLGCQQPSQQPAGPPTVPASAEGPELVPVGGMTTGRSAHTATLLPTGRVLIAGGMSRSGNSVGSAELYDPSTHSFSPAGSMDRGRASHTATLLPDGSVLILGGYNGDYVASAERYHPATGRFTPAGRMLEGRSGHTATLLSDGRVLVAGGVGDGWTFLASAELYDPAAGTSTPTASMGAARESHTATLLRDGNVLIAGGHRGRRAQMQVFASAELYDPERGAFAPTGSMNVVRHKHEATRLQDGRVLIAGGSDRRDWRGRYSSAEIYDPDTQRFMLTGSMSAVRHKIQASGVLLHDGSVLIGGGAEQAETYDPASGSFRLVTGRIGKELSFSTATLLADGDALIAGGYDADNENVVRAWLYRR